MSLWALSTTAHAYDGRIAIVCNGCTYLQTMVDAVADDMDQRGGGGTYLYLVFDINDRLAGEFIDYRYFTVECPPFDDGWRNDVQYQGEYGQAGLHEFWNIITAADFPVTAIPSSVGTSFKGTGQQTAIANYLSQHYMNTYFPLGAVGIVKFQNGSMAKYMVINANTHQFGLISNTGVGPTGCPLADEHGVPECNSEPPGMVLSPPLNIDLVNKEFHTISIKGTNSFLARACAGTSKDPHPCTSVPWLSRIFIHQCAFPQ